MTTAASPARFSFRVPGGGTVTGPVQGSGGLVSWTRLPHVALDRLLAARRIAASGRAHGLYEPATGCVAVFPDYSAEGHGEAIIVALASLVIPPTKAPRLTRAERSTVESLIVDGGYTRIEALAEVRAFGVGAR